MFVVAFTFFWITLGTYSPHGVDWLQVQAPLSHFELGSPFALPSSLYPSASSGASGGVGDGAAGASTGQSMCGNIPCPPPVHSTAEEWLHEHIPFHLPDVMTLFSNLEKRQTELWPGKVREVPYFFFRIY